MNTIQAQIEIESFLADRVSFEDVRNELELAEKMEWEYPSGRKAEFYSIPDLGNFNARMVDIALERL